MDGWEKNENNPISRNYNFCHKKKKNSEISNFFYFFVSSRKRIIRNFIHGRNTNVEFPHGVFSLVYRFATNLKCLLIYIFFFLRQSAILSLKCLTEIQWGVVVNYCLGCTLHIIYLKSVCEVRPPLPTVFLILYEIWCLFSRYKLLRRVSRSLKWKQKYSCYFYIDQSSELGV